MRKMLIGIDGNEANQGKRVGIGQFAFNVIRELEAIDKNNSYLVYLSQPPLADLPPEREGWRYKVFGPSKLWTQFALPLKLFTQKEKFDVFYSPSHYAPRFSPFPTVISIMDLWHHRHPEQFAKKDLYQLTAWESYSVKRAKRIVTISEFSKSEIVKFYKYPPERITVAYPGFDKFILSDTEEKLVKIKAKYGIAGDYLFYLGTLQPKKNLKGLIEAFSLVAKEQIPSNKKSAGVKLVIAGKKGWLYEEIFKKVETLGLQKEVIFTGFIDEDEKGYLLKGSSAFILPSFYEGLGIPVLEAMSLGVPVIVSREASLPEAGGQAAIYCDPYSIEDMARAIRETVNLKKSQRDEIIKKGLIQAKKFSWENCARQVLTALETR